MIVRNPLYPTRTELEMSSSSMMIVSKETRGVDVRLTIAKLTPESSKT